MTVWLETMRRETLLVMRKKSDVLNPLVFYLLVISLFPLGVGPAPETLARIAPGVIWVAVLLSVMLSLERLFRDDYRDGSLEQLLLSPHVGAGLILAKILSHWLMVCVPILILSPLAALLMGVSPPALVAMMLSLLVATPALSMIGAVGSALTVGVGRSGVLLSLLILPLFIPVLIFATAAIDAAAMSLPYLGQLALLAAFSAAAITLTPFAVLAALKISVQ
ncbi:heme exporter protein CcmB [Neiella marina]|uniref:Heme exporter protein B n=1 Tax=Neiella holothuriorum TaxID=2870530 RepID=A0ABS7EGF3_9GAMM|nr:heme exporter protein CcmB [Neiella holothuriorum]MBW8190777.1 heme exporter protein CcmB [Neiella holothuriorum]